MKNLVKTVVLGSALIGGVANAGTITNGNFNADLSGWFTDGRVDVSTESYGLPNTDSYMRLTAGAGDAQSGYTDGYVGAFSEASQDFWADAGDKLSFNLFFYAKDYIREAVDTVTGQEVSELFNDVAYATLLNLDNNTSVFSWKWDVKTVGDSSNTGWLIKQDILTAGNYLLAFSIANGGDNTPYAESLNSVLGVDNVKLSNGQVAATPVPAALWLFGSGIMGLMASRRKVS